MYLTLSPETNWIVGWVVHVDISVDIPFMVSLWLLDALVVIVMILNEILFIIVEWLFGCARPVYEQLLFYFSIGLGSKIWLVHLDLMNCFWNGIFKRRRNNYSRFWTVNLPLNVNKGKWFICIYKCFIKVL